MNHPVQWVFSGVSTLFPLIWLPNIFQYVAFYVSRFWIQPGIAILGLLEVLVEFLLAFMIGLLIWRMIVIGLYIWRLGNVFVLKPRMGYPDNCGGLEPIGNLCLWNILLISIAGVFLGGWIILSYSTKVGGNNPLDKFYPIASYYRSRFLWLLLIPFALSVISFFWPLWSIHEAILAGNSENKQDLDKLAKEIADLDQELIEKSDELDREQEENINKKLAIMRETYERNQRLPKWPLNLKILVEFTSSQLVPLLVALGLSSKIASALQTILGLIK